MRKCSIDFCASSACANPTYQVAWLSLEVASSARITVDSPCFNFNDKKKEFNFYLDFKEIEHSFLVKADWNVADDKTELFGARFCANL